MFHVHIGFIMMALYRYVSGYMDINLIHCTVTTRFYVDQELRNQFLTDLFWEPN